MLKLLIQIYNWYAFTCAKIRASFWELFVQKMGKDVWIMPHCSITSPKGIEIGNNVLVGNYVSLCGQGGISIGNNVMIGAFSQIMSVTHSYQGRQPIYFQPIRKEKILIGSDVWIGTHVTILPGIKIGDGSVVGANSVVTHNVPPFTVVGGVPARYIKKRFTIKKKNE